MSLVDNKRAAFDYEILEKFSAGIELLGFEVKSLRKNHGRLNGSYAIIRENEVFLLNLFIPSYQKDNVPKEYNPERTRKLLLTKAEIKRLSGLTSQKGLTLLPLSIYNKGKKIKIDVGLARTKKKFDKRNTIRERDAKRDIAREIKNVF